MKNENNMMHGLPYTGQDITGWLMSEKMNGCRAYWDGATMWTRGGREITLPQRILSQLPAGVPLDGEITAGRTQAGFETARRAVQYGKFTPACRFSVFDAPGIRADFSARYEFLRTALPASGPVHYIEHFRCWQISDAVRMMVSIQSDGGEGVMLRDPANLYRSGRTPEILKLKVAPHACPLSALR